MIDTHQTLTRRSLLLATIAATIAPSASRGSPPLRLVLIHGRQQQGLEAETLKATWMNVINTSCQRLGRPLPKDMEVAFPYYGDALDKYVKEFDLPLPSEINARGGVVDDEFLAFQAQVAQSMLDGSGITDEQVDAEYGPNPKQKGPLNWEWVQAILRALDKHGGKLGGITLEQFTRDVYLYITRSKVRKEIDEIVSKSLSSEPTIIIAHSLGSVVGYNVLRSASNQLKVALFLTIGSPLGIRAIRQQLTPIKYPNAVGDWYNAFDRRDVVALYPLDAKNFGVVPQIRNYDGVENLTSDRHGVAGYLADDEVIKVFMKALDV